MSGNINAWWTAYVINFAIPVSFGGKKVIILGNRYVTVFHVAIISFSFFFFCHRLMWNKYLNFLLAICACEHVVHIIDPEFYRINSFR